MGLLTMLLLLFLWILWDKVNKINADYEERLENLEFKNQLLIDKIQTISRQMAKEAPVRKDPKPEPEKPPVKSSTPSVAASVEKAKDETKDKPQDEEIFSDLSFDEPVTAKTKTDAEKSEKLPSRDEATYAWLKKQRQQKEEIEEATDKPAKEAFANKEAVSETKVTQRKEEKAKEDTGKAIPPPPREPDEPGWGDRWNNFIENVDWEQFTGTKLFAWLGGIALFIGAGFFVKYSIDQNLISPIMRLVIGAIIGLALIAGSFMFDAKRYAVMRHTFSAGGIGVLYSVFFAATLYYEYLPKTGGFAALCVVSAAAFVLAIFHKGVSISVLGAIGAYITPLLVTTGQGNILTLYLYLAIVNAGVYQVIKKLDSMGLLLFSTTGTMISLGLASVFAKPEPEAMYIAWAWLGHLSLFAVFFNLLKDRISESWLANWSVNITYAMMPVVAFLLALFKQGSSPMLLLSGSAVVAIILGFKINQLGQKVIGLALISFLVTAFWAFFRFTPDIDNWAYLLFFIYGLASGAGPVLIIYKHGIDAHYLQWFRIFPVAIALLGLMAILVNPNVSVLFWPMTIALQLVGIAISLIFGAVFQVGILSLILVIAALLFITSSAVLTFTIGFYGFIFVAGALICLVTFILLRNLAKVSETLNLDKDITEPLRLRPALTDWMSASPVIGIFFVLAAAFLKSAPLNPHPGMVIMLCFLGVALTLTRRLKFEHLGIVSLFSAAFAQAFWVFRPHTGTDLYFAALLWSIAFFAAALVLPFIFYRSYKDWKKLWMSFAIFEVIQVVFVIFAADHIWSRDYSGWIPLVFALIKIPIVIAMLRQLDKKPERNSIIACHGGVTLFYVSALPVLLLENGWLGLILVLESTALLWLNTRIEHSGLRWVSAVMAPVGLYLLLSFIPQMKGPDSLIILNPAVLSVLAAVFSLAASVKLASYPDEHLGGYNLVKYFQWIAFGTGFYLVNLTVADVFAGSKVEQGPTIKFLPSGNLLQQIAYTMLWACFGALLWCREKLPLLLRYIGLALVFISSAWLITFPIWHGKAVAAMAPFFNLGLLAYLPIMAVLLFLFLREPWGTSYITFKNFFLALLLLSGFICIKVVKATIFQPGMPLDLFVEKTARMAVASIAGWLIYGLAMLLWPKRLDKPFRNAGLILIIFAFLRSLNFPFRYAADFGAMTPVLNHPSLLYLFIVGALIWLTARKPQSTWPVDFINAKSFWAISLAIMSFLIMNIEVASIFGEKGRAFSLLTRGSLSHQLGYSISWLVYAIIMLVSGIKWKTVRARQTALVLIIITSLKIFLKDLWSLGQLYRVASFIGLAIVMMMVSYLYQRFLSKMGDKENEK